MTAQILVPLKRNDRVEEILPYVEQVTQPGMKVVFLMPVHDREINCWRDQRTFMEVERQTRLAAGLSAGHLWESKASLAHERHFHASEYSWEDQRRSYQEALFPLCEPLRKKSCAVTVALYMGSLRKALRCHLLGNDDSLIVVRPGIGCWLARLFDGTGFALFKRPSFRPVLLMQTTSLR